MFLVFAALIGFSDLSYGHNLVNGLAHGDVIRCFEAREVKVRCDDGGGSAEVEEKIPLSELEISVSNNGKVYQVYGYGRMIERDFCDKHLRDIRWVMRKLKKTDTVCISSSVEHVMPIGEPHFALWDSVYTKRGKAER